MNVDDPKLTAYALDELDESERSAIARATADSPEMQRFVADTQDLARALRSQYRLELQRGLVAPEKLTDFSRRYFLAERRAARDCSAHRRLSCSWRSYVQR